jgi:hypothetical protein
LHNKTKFRKICAFLIISRNIPTFIMDYKSKVCFLRPSKVLIMTGCLLFIVKI